MKLFTASIMKLCSLDSKEVIMLSKKYTELTTGEMLKLSAIITVVCFIPYGIVLAKEFVAMKKLHRKEED